MPGIEGVTGTRETSAFGIGAPEALVTRPFSVEVWAAPCAGVGALPSDGMTKAAPRAAVKQNSHIVFLNNMRSPITKAFFGD